jgi:hypothetical protein
MCDPATGVAVASLLFAARNQQQQGKFQEKTANFNARVAENQAESERAAGTEAEITHRNRVNRFISTQRARLASSNVDLTSGSAAGLQEDSFLLGEADALRIRSNTGSRVDALRSGASLLTQQGDFASSAGNRNAFATVLGGTANVLDSGVADKWLKPSSAARIGNPHR